MTTFLRVGEWVENAARIDRFKPMKDDAGRLMVRVIYDDRHGTEEFVKGPAADALAADVRLFLGIDLHKMAGVETGPATAWGDFASLARTIQLDGESDADARKIAAHWNPQAEHDAASALGEIVDDAADRAEAEARKHAEAWNAPSIADGFDIIEDDDADDDLATLNRDLRAAALSLPQSTGTVVTPDLTSNQIG